MSSNDIDKLTLDIIDENDKIIYREINLPEIIISASKKENVKTSLEKGLKKFLKREGKPSRIWEWMEVYRDFAISKNDYTKPGHYILFWNGFDSEGIYDSSIFDKKTFRARLTGIKGEKKKTAEVSFRTEYAEVNWVDVRIDQNNKRIDTTLRVNLKDGGAEGLSPQEQSNIYEPAYTQTIYPWDKIPQKDIKKYKKEPIKERTKSFEELRDMALEGINKHWSRHAGNIGEGVQIGENFYEVFVNAEQNEKGMVAPRIIYFTNSENNNFNRSHNWFLSRKLFYKVGYVKENIWNYIDENKALLDFQETSAHEIGHKLLEDYGGKTYSYKHKGSSTWGQSPLKGTTYPKTGEIDLMKYTDEDFLPKDFYERVVLSKEDVIGILWLTKINIK